MSTILAVGQTVEYASLSQWAPQCINDPADPRVVYELFNGRMAYLLKVCAGDNLTTNASYPNVRAQIEGPNFVNTVGGVYRQEWAMDHSALPTSLAQGPGNWGVLTVQPNFGYLFQTSPPLQFVTHDGQHMVLETNTGKVLWTGLVPRNHYHDYRLTFQHAVAGWVQLEIFTAGAWQTVLPQTNVPTIVSGESTGPWQWRFDVYAAAKTVQAAGGQIGPLAFAGIAGANGPRITRIA